MRTLIHITNGAIIYGVAGYWIGADWQAWALILWFVFATGAIERITKNEIREKMTLYLDNIERTLKRFQRG